MKPNPIETPLETAVSDVQRWTFHNTPVGILEHGKTIAALSIDRLQGGQL
ncbi:MAG: hypothetical protein IH895_09610 [Planctomycetes bacterium]|nr:hypothetical protein [Planctomycetota bacterium]